MSETLPGNLEIWKSENKGVNFLMNSTCLFMSHREACGILVS